MGGRRKRRKQVEVVSAVNFEGSSRHLLMSLPDVTKPSTPCRDNYFSDRATTQQRWDSSFGDHEQGEDRKHLAANERLFVRLAHDSKRTRPWKLLGYCTTDFQRTCKCRRNFADMLLAQPLEDLRVQTLSTSRTCLLSQETPLSQKVRGVAQ